MFLGDSDQEKLPKGIIYGGGYSPPGARLPPFTTHENKLAKKSQNNRSHILKIPSLDTQWLTALLGKLTT
jgi:hypothetical protein